MKSKFNSALMLALALTLVSAMLTTAQQPGTRSDGALPRPKGPCDVYADAGDPCVAAHSTTRALYAAYNGPLYQVLRRSDGKTLDIGVVQPVASPAPDPGGFANAPLRTRSAPTPTAGSPRFTINLLSTMT
jgi:non-reducing end alpha-L-arabinofuranosidase